MSALHLAVAPSAHCAVLTADRIMAAAAKEARIKVKSIVAGVT